MRLLIIGASGMLGYTLFHALGSKEKYDVHGTVRSVEGCSQYFDKLSGKVHSGIDIYDFNSLRELVLELKPDVILNCVGIIKQLDAAKLPVESISINSLLPHKLAALCDEVAGRLVHFSTDCVFSGERGVYLESDIPDSSDLYGRSKLLGEVNYGRHITLRTSIVGHELKSSNSLVDWFLGQNDAVNGYSRAIFSGLPTIEIANVLDGFVFPNEKLTGLYHLAVKPINKFSLLLLLKKHYGIDTDINEFSDFVLDRSLNAERFYLDSGYQAPEWDELIFRMHEDYISAYVPNR